MRGQEAAEPDDYPDGGAVPVSTQRAAQLLFVSGGLTALSAASVLLIASLPALKLLLTLVVLVLGGCQIRIGTLLLALVDRARTAALVSAGAVCGLSLVGPARSLAGTVIAVAVNFGIVFFLRQPDARARPLAKRTGRTGKGQP